MTTETLWQPNPGPQTRFLASTADECLYGGAAGGGKSAASVSMYLRWIEYPAFRGLFLRREAKYLSDALDKSGALYPKFGGRLVQSPKIIWKFPSGAQIWLNHCEHERDVANYDSLEFHVVVFEELTHFTEKQYLGINARIRRTDTTLPGMCRATCNPGGDGAEWVFRRFGAWLDPDAKVRAESGEKLWYLGDDIVAPGTPLAQSRTFIPARLSDNPKIDPTYAGKLMQLDPVRRAQLLDGNWLVKPAAGAYFKRAWLPIVDAAPVGIPRVRYWDRASTEDGGDWTAGVRMSRGPDGLFYVEDVVRVRHAPGGVEATIKRTADLDGRGCQIVLEQDPGSAGKFEASYYVRELAGLPVKAMPKRKDKVTAASPFSAQCAGGNVRLVRGAWNEALVQELESFPEGQHDDQVDAASGAFAALCLVPHRANPIMVGRPRSAGW